MKSCAHKLRLFVRRMLRDCQNRFRLFKNRRELRKVEYSFFKRNNLPLKNSKNDIRFLRRCLGNFIAGEKDLIDSQARKSDKYLKFFRRNLGNFIAGNEALNDAPQIKKFLLTSIEKNFTFYSEHTIDNFLRQKYKELILELDDEDNNINSCYISAILNKDTSTNNSSKELMKEFKRVNELDSNKILTLEKYINREIKYQEDLKEINEKIERNRNNIYYPKKEMYITRVYNIDKAKLITTLERELASKDYLIFIDDFSGSGKTIIQFFKFMEDYIPQRVKIIIICVHMMENAENKLKSFFESSKYVERVKIYTDTLNPLSRKKVFNHEKMFDLQKKKKLKELKELKALKEELREFETENFEKQFALGFEATEALVATYQNCPNNTFACFWYPDNEKWTPLFSRPRKRSQALDSINLNLNDWLKKIKYALRQKGVVKTDIQLIIVLILIKTNLEKTTTKVEIDLKDKFQYNISCIQEYINQGFIIIKYNSQGVSTYSLTNSGKDKLKTYHLSAINFEKLIKTKEFDSTDKTNLVSNDYESELLNHKSAE